MDKLTKIIWAEGLLLGQQHLQAWENQLMQQQQFRWQHSLQYAWGCINIKIDEDTLKNGEFNLLKCQFILSDGQLIHYDHEVANDPLCCQLSELNNERISIYLCLPRNNWVSNIHGYPAKQEEQQCKWQGQYVTLSDCYDQARQREVLLAELNLSLATTRPSHRQSIKIAEVIYNEHQQYIISKDYCAPALQLKAQPFLIEQIRKLVEMLTAKINFIKMKGLEHNQLLTEFSHHQLINFLLLQTLTRALPQLKHMQRHVDAHPLQLYINLITLIAELSCFNEKMTSVDPPPYQHHQLASVFNTLMGDLGLLLERLMPVSLAKVKLIKRSDNEYVAERIDSLLLNDADFYLAVKCQDERANWVEPLTRQLKIGSLADIEDIVVAALAGISITHCIHLPGKLPIKSQYEYFRLVTHGEYWEQVKQTCNLAIYLPSEFKDVLIELMVVENS